LVRSIAARRHRTPDAIEGVVDVVPDVLLQSGK
jgi:hypothetical protein